MRRFNPYQRFGLIAILGVVAIFCFEQRAIGADGSAATQPASQLVDLALNKPATASATESDEHAAGKANDGDDDTRWCADGDSTPQWWQVDLGAPASLTGCRIMFEFDEKSYQYVVEGSADGSAWKTLSDQSASTEKKQVQSLSFAGPGDGIRYLRIRITGLDEGAWASLCDVKVFGK